MGSCFQNVVLQVPGKQNSGRLVSSIYRINRTNTCTRVQDSMRATRRQHRLQVVRTRSVWAVTASGEAPIPFRRNEKRGRACE